MYALKCLNIVERCRLFSLYRVEKIFLLIFHEQREVASEAAQFLHRRICSRVSKDVESEEEEFSDFEMKSQIYISELVSFLQECPHNCSEEFLIDALINKSKFLTNWPAWINLLEEGSSIHDEFDVELIMNLMSCTLKLANTGMLPVGRKAKKGKSTASIISRNIQESSKIFKGNIDKLLEKYASNDRIFYILLRCFRYLSFEEVDEVFALDFALKFHNILSCLNDSRDLAVYNECGVVFAMFCKNSVRKLNCNSDEWELIKNEIEVIYELLENVCHTTIEKIFDETMNKDLEKSIEVAALYSLQDIAESVCWNSLFVDACKMISSRKHRDSMIAELFLIVCFMSLMWISAYFIERNFENGEVEIEMIYEEKLREASQQFFSKIHDISRGRTSTIGSTLKMTARNIMRLLKKLSLFIEKKNGLPFLMYSMHFE
ncbi:uncharacterized protein LOC120349995 [Nilaparvata lugens]|uniref:uncharacterized protein LOC120349995 n=1 Tax=Nilaparvata lugens TaxID=108931 RepID=UPI00193DA691|nr:uncharacterized protein LOC120349995 [Nilaparvata lugens]